MSPRSAGRPPAAADEESPGQTVRAVTRALAILTSFTRKGVQSLADVTASTGLDKGTTRRLLLTLKNGGFIVHDPVSQQYRLGRAVRELAANATSDLDLRAVAQPILAELSSELHVTAFLSIYDGGDVVCLERLHDMKGVEVHWWAIGGVLPYNCGAAPKLLLAFQPAEEIERVLARAPSALTPKSATNRDDLRQRLTRIRKQDWELAIDDVALGLSALAAPVRRADGEVLCAVSIAGLTPQMAVRGRPVHLERLRTAARTIERRLNGETPTVS